MEIIEKELLRFFEHVNSYHDTIKYTWEWSENCISFLNVQLKLENGKISTGLYQKPTDTRQYLDYASCHPSHAKRAILYSQALRIRRICDSDEVFKDRLN